MYNNINLRVLMTLCFSGPLAPRILRHSASLHFSFAPRTEEELLENEANVVVAKRIDGGKDDTPCFVHFCTSWRNGKNPQHLHMRVLTPRRRIVTPDTSFKEACLPL